MCVKGVSLGLSYLLQTEQWLCPASLPLTLLCHFRASPHVPVQWPRMAGVELALRCWVLGLAASGAG